jgi:O-antigen/teichoic acid export membrane protein
MVQLRSAGLANDIRQLTSAVLHVGAWFVPPAVSACLASPAIISVFFGSEFESATHLFQVLLWAGLARMAVSIVTVLLAGAGQSSWAWEISAPLVPLAVLGYVILIPIAGAMGAAWATALASLAGVWLSVRALSRNFGARCPARTIAMACLSSLVIAALAWAWPFEATGALVYVVGVAVFSFAAMWLTLPHLTLSGAALPGVSDFNV